MSLKDKWIAGFMKAGGWSDTVSAEGRLGDTVWCDEANGFVVLDGSRIQGLNQHLCNQAYSDELQERAEVALYESQADGSYWDNAAQVERERHERPRLVIPGFRLMRPPSDEKDDAPGCGMR
ncbi:MAG TPA: hypothetical protein VNR89_17460 [Roseomonas sp.]|nr:hypothetical protein [Roseomonas sp.]